MAYKSFDDLLQEHLAMARMHLNANSGLETYVLNMTWLSSQIDLLSDEKKRQDVREYMNWVMGRKSLPRNLAISKGSCKLEDAIHSLALLLLYDEQIGMTGECDDFLEEEALRSLQEALRAAKPAGRYERFRSYGRRDEEILSHLSN